MVHWPRQEVVNQETGEFRKVMALERVIDRMVDMMMAREREGRHYGTIVIAEGMAEYLPSKYLEGISRDDHGHINISSVNLAAMISAAAGRTIHRANRVEPQDQWTATRLRIAVCPAARLRRDARIPIGSRCLSGAGRGETQRRHGFRLRPTRSALRSLRGTRRSSQRWSPRSASSNRKATSIGLARFLETCIDS